MARKGSPAASAEDSSSTALAERPATAGAMAVTDGYDRMDRRGKGDMSQGDLKIPRIALAQRTSKQLESGSDVYIEGLELFQMFNTLTMENYGNGPVEFVVVRRSKKAMQFDADLNIVDRDVPMSDRRLQWTDGPKGPGSVAPIATLFQEYLILLLPSLEPVMLSMKRTQLSVATKLNSLLEYRPGPSWAGRYKLTSTSKAHGKFTSGQYVVSPAGATPPEVAEIAENWFERTEGVDIDTDREAGRDDDGRAPAEPSEDDIPFN